MAAHSIEEVLRERTDAWLAIPGVVGTAIGSCSGRPCIQVLVTARTAQIDAEIPSEVEGYPVLLLESGGFSAQERR